MSAFSEGAINILALQFAKLAVELVLKKQGIALSRVETAEINSAAKDLVGKDPAFRVEAKRVLDTIEGITKS